MRWLSRRRLIALLIGCVWAGTTLWHLHKPLPAGLHTDGAWQSVPADQLRFLADVTGADAYGQPIIRQEIFDEWFAVIARARRYIVIDMFLFNDHSGRMSTERAPLRPLSRELRDALLAARARTPQLRVLLIVDPINDVYGGDPSPDLALLQDAGIDVVRCDLDRLRDSNPWYSGAWRLLLSWWLKPAREPGWLPNPFESGPDGVGFGSWARLANLKADHRKVLLADDGGAGIVGIVGSANAHDASSAHSNVAIELSGGALQPLLASELAIARFSHWRGDWLEPILRELPPIAPQPGATLDVAVHTEGAIADFARERIAATRAGDRIDIAMFYLSYRPIIDALLEAAERGVVIRLLLDPNKDAFGRVKSGRPNRPVAAELVSASNGAIRVRWYRTHGEQFHSKLLLVQSGETVWVSAGSANFTRRNIGDFNLEANLSVRAPAGSGFAQMVGDYFELLWQNRAPVGVEYSAEYPVYADARQSSYIAYRVMEATGLSSF
ncbi:MAG: phospholipase D-like domain-containing protein [Steroidobacteraceae bacterium]